MVVSVYIMVRTVAIVKEKVRGVVLNINRDTIVTKNPRPKKMNPDCNNGDKKNAGIDPSRQIKKVVNIGPIDRIQCYFIQESEDVRQ